MSRRCDPACRAELEELLREVNQALAAHERLAMIVIAAAPWSIEEGLLTPTMKIRRNRIEASVATRVDGWYAARTTVQWA